LSYDIFFGGAGGSGGHEKDCLGTVFMIYLYFP